LGSHDAATRSRNKQGEGQIANKSMIEILALILKKVRSGSFLLEANKGLDAQQSNVATESCF